MRCHLSLVLLLAILSTSVEESIAQQENNAEGPERVFNALEQFENMYRGLEINYEFKAVLSEEPVRQDWLAHRGRLAWDKRDCKLIEREDFEPDASSVGKPLTSNTPVGHWEKRSGFFGESFKVVCSRSADLHEDEEEPGLKAWLDMNDELRDSWRGLLLFQSTTLNQHDEPGLLYSDLLRQADFSGVEVTPPFSTYTFHDKLRGIYSVTLDDSEPARIVRFKVEKLADLHTYRGIRNLSFHWQGAKKIFWIIDEFQYDDRFGVVVGWRSRNYFVMPDGSMLPPEGRPRTFEEFAVVDLKPAKVHNPKNIKFEIVPPFEGQRVTVPEEKGIEYRWMNNRIVRVVDGNVLQNLDGSFFYPRSSGFFASLGFCLLAIMAFGVWYWVARKKKG